MNASPGLTRPLLPRTARAAHRATGARLPRLQPRSTSVPEEPSPPLAPPDAPDVPRAHSRRLALQTAPVVTLVTSAPTAPPLQHCVTLAYTLGRGLRPALHVWLATCVRLARIPRLKSSAGLAHILSTAPLYVLLVWLDITVELVPRRQLNLSVLPDLSPLPVVRVVQTAVPGTTVTLGPILQLNSSANR